MRKLGFLGYAASALLVLLMGWALYWVAGDAMQSATLVDHSLHVISQISGVNASIARAESAHRGFLLYNEDRFLAERDREMQKARIFAEGIGALTADDPVQQARTAQLLRALDDRLARMLQTTEQRRAQGTRVPSPRVPGGMGQKLSARIYDLTGAMSQDELRLLDQRKAEQGARFEGMHYVLAGIFFIFLAVVIPGYAVFVREARARRRAERTMLELAESLPGAVFQYRSYPDGKGRFELLSSATERLRGVNRESALRDSRVIFDTMLDTDRKAFMGALAHSEKMMSPLVFDYRILVNGRMRWIRSTSAPRREKDGSVLWSGHWDDVTMQRELEGELLRSKEAADAANRAKSTFLATMSHEIRTPMNGVLGMLELLSLSKLDHEQQATLGVVRESGRSLLRIIDDILDFSKIEAGKLELAPEPTSVADTVERVWNMYSGTASSKGLLLKRSSDPRISPYVIADPVRLQQILNNFVSNALKFTPAGEVSIGAYLAEHREGRDVVRFTVEDTGIGVSREQKARLFQPFAQADEHIAGHYGGTGLGLSIARRLATLMGGSVEMDSEPGRGTRLHFTVPLPVANGVGAQLQRHASVAAAEVAVRPAPSIADGERVGRLVLVVDDHPINRMVMVRQVNTLGYAAEMADNGLEAMEKWSTGRFAAVLTDCNMPELSGYQLARDIRSCEARHGYARTPIIACTANALGGEAEKCFAAGMDDYLAKPVELVKLAEKLARWLPLDGDNPGERAVPEGAAPGGTAPLDPQMLDEIAGGDERVAIDLLARFQRYNMEDARRLREAAGTGDVEQITVFSHRIKGASRTIGATGLAQVCERLERASKAQDLREIETNIPQFNDEVERLHAYIRSRG